MHIMRADSMQICSKNKCQRLLRSYPMKEREQDDLQLIDLKVVLWVGQISSNLKQSSEY
jgi:hypothetical protein